MSFAGHTHSKKTREQISLNHANVSGKNNPWFGKKRPDHSKKMMGENNPMFGRIGKDNPMYCMHRIGKNAPFYGKRHSVKTREKMRETTLGRVTPNFNPTACQKIEEYGKKHGYHFQHALNGGEVHVIGYSLDGYDSEKNVVIEYYEKRHQRRKKQDEQRKKQIIQQLGCKFIELKGWK